MPAKQPEANDAAELFVPSVGSFSTSRYILRSVVRVFPHLKGYLPVASITGCRGVSGTSNPPFLKLDLIQMGTQSELAYDFARSGNLEGTALLVPGARDRRASFVCSLQVVQSSR
eukprot:1320064-Amorphochlora_amoeboformis.AAC.1